MFKTCKHCFKKSAILIQSSRYKILCRSCHGKDKKVLTKLIKKLPDVGPIRAPLGYFLFEREVIKDTAQAELFANVMYAQVHVGAMN